MIREPSVITWNSPRRLAPVDLWILITLPDGSVVRAKRTRHIETRESPQEYELEDGTTLCGEYPWAPT